MRNLLAFVLIVYTHLLPAQTSNQARQDSIVPEGTTIPLVLIEQVSSQYARLGDIVGFVVAEDVRVNGAVLILAGSKVNGMITTLNGYSKGINDGAAPPQDESTSTDMKIEARWVQHVNGNVIRLNDCWIYTTAAENPLPESEGALFLKDTRKNCTATR